MQEVKLGRLPAKKDPRTLKLSSYLVPTLPKPPKERRWSDGRQKWGMMRNDRLGDCTIAAIAHGLQIWTMQTTGDVTVPDDVVEYYYSKWAGYVPGRPSTDRGAYELDILNKWRHDGFMGHELIAYVEPDPLDEIHVKQAICLFGGLYIGLDLPKSAQFQQVWDVAKDPIGEWGGHAVFVPDYDENYLTCVTWGRLQKMTWAFWKKYCMESHALLAADWLPHFGGHEPINKQALINDLERVAGKRSSAASQ